MNTPRIPSILGTALLALLGATAPALAQWTDSFDTADSAWIVDRYAPDGFGTVSFGGDNRLQITVSTADNATNRPAAFSSSFYNTQGRRYDLSGYSAPWTLSAQAYLDSAFNTTTGTLARSDLWARDTNPVENQAFYPIFGFTNASPTDGFNPAAADRSFRLRAFDSSFGWRDLDLPAGLSFDAWHTFSISATGSTYEYLFDDVLLYTQPAYSDPGADGLKSAYIQAYNFGGSGYSVLWDNVSAIPEPGTYAIWFGGTTLLVVLIRKRRRHEPL